MLIGPLPEIVLQQNIDIVNSRFIIRENEKGRDVFDFKDGLKYTFKRFLNNDTFNLIINGDIKSDSSIALWVPTTNLNNIDATITNSTFPDHVDQMEQFPYWEFQIPAQHLANTEFADLEMSAIGMDGKTKDGGLKEVRSILNWNISPLSSQVTSDFEHIIHLKIPKYVQVEVLEDSFKPIYQLNLKYLNFYLKPNLPSYDKPTQSLVDIYALDEMAYDDKDDNNFARDLDFFTTGTLKSSAVKSGLKTEFKYRYDKKQNYLTAESERADFVGSIRTIDSTYYDYEKQAVVKGINSKSIVNDQIPYNFSGDYVWDLELDLNKIIDNFSLNLVSKIEKPLLDLVNGKIKLDLLVDQDSVYQELDYELTWDDIEIIRNHPEITWKEILDLGQKTS